jgi:hypothetical protein
MGEKLKPNIQLFLKQFYRSFQKTRGPQHHNKLAQQQKSKDKTRIKNKKCHS